MVANKAVGCQFEKAIKCLGVDLRPNLGTIKDDDFCFTERRSGLGSALESPKKMEGTGAGVQGLSPEWDETQFLTKSSSFYDVFGRGLGRGPAEGD